MNNIDVKIKKLRETAVIPQYQTSLAAAADLVAAVEVVIPAGGRALVPTGIALEFSGAVCLLFARSGLAVKQGISLANGVGVVDADYRGEIMAALVNHTDRDYTVKVGDRVAQMMFAPVYTATFVTSAELTDTDRGEGGFGSTGV